MVLWLVGHDKTWSFPPQGEQSPSLKQSSPFFFWVSRLFCVFGGKFDDIKGTTPTTVEVTKKNGQKRTVVVRHRLIPSPFVCFLKISTIEALQFAMNTPSKRKDTLSPESPKNGKKSREEGKETTEEHNHSKNEMLPIELVVPVPEHEQHTEDLDMIPGFWFTPQLTFHRTQNLLRWGRKKARTKSLRPRTSIHCCLVRAVPNFFFRLLNKIEWLYFCFFEICLSLDILWCPLSLVVVANWLRLVRILAYKFRKYAYITKSNVGNCLHGNLRRKNLSVPFGISISFSFF